ncbi:ATP/GTP-binding protein [Phytohabitans suffuscus]|uniref:NadR/Ttd14 AAA domain-containing protein n=1 Tax=Phytohabitans suffuscus TaxID=624315 RepID=A0A6F8YE19_9ACTN|nr:ATP-binding protein [Phytohabitans suffuscus]BCB84273.1 hypothetical protein Psuf_015860 [Phytohabitans suffuscus]
MTRKVARWLCGRLLITGTHSTGKTTLVTALTRLYRDQKVVALSEGARQCPFELNQSQNDLSTTWLLATQIKTEIEATTQSDARLVICDRGVPDILSYHLATVGKVPSGLESLALEWLAGYDHILLARPDKARSMTPDELRVNDARFRDEVQATIERLVFDFGTSVDVLPDDMSQRIDMTADHLATKGLLP